MVMKSIRRRIEVEVLPTSGELASMFCEMDADEQAHFFNSVAYESARWKRDFVFQLQAITDSPVLHSTGREIMRGIGEYAQPSQK